jgi:hypothetical protein
MMLGSLLIFSDILSQIIKFLSHSVATFLGTTINTLASVNNFKGSPYKIRYWHRKVVKTKTGEALLI